MEGEGLGDLVTYSDVT